jgi:hypothetical protein
MSTTDLITAIGASEYGKEQATVGRREFQWVLVDWQGKLNRLKEPSWKSFSVNVKEARWKTQEPLTAWGHANGLS